MNKLRRRNQLIVAIVLSLNMFGGAWCHGQSSTHAETEPWPSDSVVESDTGAEALDKSGESVMTKIKATNVRRDDRLRELSELLEISDMESSRNRDGVDSLGGTARDSNALLNAKRINSIHERIHLIRNLMDQKQTDSRLDEIARRMRADQSPTAIVNTTTEIADRLGPTPTADERTKPTGEPAAESPSTAMPARAVDENPDPANGDNQPKDVPADASAGWGTTVVTEPVDSFELASSLFLTGNFSAARNTCEARLKTDVDPDLASWLRCLIGCCYRMEGEYDKAEMMFRDVTNQQQLTYPSDYARWSLGYLQQRRNMNEQFGAIQAEIESLVAEQVEP